MGLIKEYALFPTSHNSVPQFSESVWLISFVIVITPSIEVTYHTHESYFLSGKLFAYSSAEPDEFSRSSQTYREKNEFSLCEPRHNIASGTTTGLEVFLKPSKPEDSLQDGQRDKAGSRVSCHKQRMKLVKTPHNVHLRALKFVLCMHTCIYV